MLLSLLLWACDSDVSIIKRYDEDTAQSIGIGEPSYDPPIPSAEPSFDPERQGITGLSTTYLRQLACPACMGETQELLVEYEAIFHEPISDVWNDWMLDDGQCTEQLYQTQPSTIPYPVGSQIQINNPSHQFAAQQYGAATYVNPQLWEAQLQRNSNYMVQTNEGSFEFRTIEGFDWIEPYTMLWVDPSYAFDAIVSRNGFTITWSPARQTSRMMVTLGIYSQDGSYLLGQVSCFGADNGSLSIPSQYLNYQPLSLVAIHMERFEVDFVETDINNAYMETLQIWEVVGTGHIE